MSSTTPSHGYFSIGNRLLGFATFLLAIAAGMVISPTFGGAADRAATAEKRITVIASDPAVTAEPVGASSADGFGAAGATAQTAARPSTAAAANPDTAARSRVLDALRKAPLGFIDNRGQADPRAAFYARRGSATFWLTRDGVVFDLARKTRAAAAGVRPVSADGSDLAAMSHGQWERAVITENFLDVSPAVKLDPQMELPTSYGYIHGSDSSRWLAGVKSYRLITYRGIWKGVDLRLYGVSRDPEQEFVVAPGANPDAIRIGLSGARKMRIASDGALLIDTVAGPMRELPPFAYQHAGGKRIAVGARFTLEGGNRVGFAIAPYDHSRPLVIDPPVLYATYLGGIHDDQGEAITVDAAGNTYVAGYSASTAFPVSANAFQTARADVGFEIYNTFVTKLSPAGALLYSTFVGGTPDKGGTCGVGFFGDCAQRIAVDGAGNAYVTGTTSSSDFPVTPTAFQPAFGGGTSDAFLCELSPDGSHLVYSTFVGGTANEGGAGIATDGSGHVWVGGEVRANGTSQPPPGRFKGQSSARTTVSWLNSI